MNIKEAFTEVENSVRAYLTKSKYGEYRIPVVRQRPLLIIGAPGIGKTAIMEQVAQKLNIGIVAYSMTHHTRQSAIGLPYIEKKTYDGKEYSVSEYTMSEIVSSIYEYMEETGVKEGILFLDEINCISETLSPAMLQFLQYKTFGNNRIPDGWVIVTAGNPPEYNKSVREFDIVTLDRVKKIEVEPDFDVWKEYALMKGIHGAVVTYLEIKKNNFYSVESTVDGKIFVTARGWEDLSEMITLYEELGIEVNEGLCAQYVQHKAIAKDFSVYYDLYNKYKSDYKVIDILEGKYTDEVKQRAADARFDEKVVLIGLLTGAVADKMKEDIQTEEYITELHKIFKGLKTFANSKTEKRVMTQRLKEILTEREEDYNLKHNKSLISREKEAVLRRTMVTIEEYYLMLVQKGVNDRKDGFDIIKKDFDIEVKVFEKGIERTKGQIDNMFAFVEEAFGKGQEMLLLVTEMTSNYYCAKFISKYGAEKYFENNKDMLFYERQNDIMKEISIIESIKQG
ncbi:MAG: AAA family ATPase [Firmicutes bacterium]|nr:AAA family ATPase [Bacillota bacterium]